MFVCMLQYHRSYVAELTPSVAHRFGESEIFFIEATNLRLIMSNTEQIYFGTY